MKMLKRTVAGEYSRELGVKVFAGQWRVYEKGFRGSGGCPGYGLRRMLVSSEGALKQILSSGEIKNIQTDRVKLVPVRRKKLNALARFVVCFWTTSVASVISHANLTANDCLSRSQTLGC